MKRLGGKRREMTGEAGGARFPVPFLCLRSWREEGTILQGPGGAAPMGREKQEWRETDDSE